MVEPCISFSKTVLSSALHLLLPHSMDSRLHALLASKRNNTSKTSHEVPPEYQTTFWNLLSQTSLVLVLLLSLADIDTLLPSLMSSPATSSATAFTSNLKYFKPSKHITSSSPTLLINTSRFSIQTMLPSIPPPHSNPIYETTASCMISLLPTPPLQME